MRAKMRTLPPEVAMKIVREGLRQKKESPSSFADWLAGSGLFEKYRQWQGYRRYGTTNFLCFSQPLALACSRAAVTALPRFW